MDWALGPCNCGPNVFAACGPLLQPTTPDQGRGSFKSLLLNGEVPTYAVPPLYMGQILVLGWVTGQTGGSQTEIDGLYTGNFLQYQIPVFIGVSIGDDWEIWKLRAWQVGDPTATSLPNYITPQVNPNNYIWVRIL